MITRYTIFRADGTKEEREVDWPAEPDYESIARLVEPVVGDTLEHVSVLFEDEATDMFIDEIGHMRIGGPKPSNKAATEIFQAHPVSKGLRPEELPIILGDVVVFHRRVWYLEAV